MEVPDLGGALPPDWLETSDLGSVPPPGWISEMPMFAGLENRDSRAALLAPTGSVYLFPIEPPAGGRLVTAAGYLILPDAVGRTLRFRASLVEPGEEARVLLDREVTVAADGGWVELEADLGLERPREVELRLEVLGDGGVTWAGWATPEIRPPHETPVPSPPPLDVVLISLDTLRADHLGGWGYERETSPFLDRFSRRGTRFLRAFAPSPWTRPSHRSLLTGLHPVSYAGFESPALPLLLHRGGFRTAAITGGGQIDYRFGFHSGFETFEVRDWLHEADRVVDHLEDGRGRSDFLFLHTYEIHDPYDHDELAQGLPAGRLKPGFSKHEWKALDHDLTEDEKRYVTALYDSGIRHVDRQLEGLFGELETRGLLESAIIALVADHGEQLFEHGSWRHGAWLWEHQIHVPLILWLPEPVAGSLGGAAGVPTTITAPVRLIDVYPTLLDLVGLGAEHPIQGRSLLPLLVGRDEPVREAFAENTNGVYERKAVVEGDWKLILSARNGTTVASPETERQLFHLGNDPGETEELSAAHPETAERLADRVLAIAAGAAPPEDSAPEDLPEDLREQLRALGYLD